jgi:hypothetical protein
MLQYVYFAVDRCWAVTDGMEVSVKLGLVMVVLRLSIRVQVILATEVGEGACLSKRDVYVVDSESDRSCCWLFHVGPVVWELVGAKFGMGEVKFEYLGERRYQVGLLL